MWNWPLIRILISDCIFINNLNEEIDKTDYTGLNCKYCLDELGNLTLYFYAENELVYIRLAERMPVYTIF